MLTAHEDGRAVRILGVQVLRGRSGVIRAEHRVLYLLSCSGGCHDVLRCLATLEARILDAVSVEI